MMTVLLAAALLAPAEQAVVVARDGSSRRVAVEELDEAVLAVAHHLWVWGAELPPQRVEPPTGAALAALRRGERQKVKLPPVGEGEPPAALEVLAAPRPMWEEVPESLLPAWPVVGTWEVTFPYLPEHPWRLRVRGPKQASWWVEVPPGGPVPQLAVQPAVPLVLALEGEAGGEVGEAGVTLRTPADGRPGGGHALALYLAEGGRVGLPALPPHREVLLTVLAPGFAPATWEGALAALPPTLRLPVGGTVSGTVANAKGEPLVGAAVRLEFFLFPKGGLVLARSATTDAHGRFHLASVPLGPVVLTVTAPGHGPKTLRASLEAAALELGAVVLSPPLAVRVELREEGGLPVAGARVRLRAGASAVSDERGVAVVQVDPREEGELSVNAEGFLPASHRQWPPWPEAVQLRLERAFRVTGRLVDEDGAPVPAAPMLVSSQSRVAAHSVDHQGRFALDLVPRQEVTLSFLPPGRRQLEVHLPPGDPGETRELGNVRSPRGGVVRLRAVVEEDGSPVPGARLWTLRPGEGGVVEAWALVRLLEAAGAPDGAVELGGLPDGPGLLRLEAPGRARRHLSVDVRSAEGPVDLGEVSLSVGQEVVVLVDGAADGAVARVDLRGEWLDMDMLTAPVEQGRARIPHVPPGPVTVSVMQEQELLCDEEITVEGQGRGQEVRCRAGRLRVQGLVVVGGAARGAGTLTWSTGTQHQGGVILTRSGGSGLQQQSCFDSGRPDVSVAVGGDGSFTSDRLRPGEWNVTFTPTGGQPLPPRRVALPEGEEAKVVLNFEGGVVVGRVVDRQGEGVAEARVDELTMGGGAMAAADGSFTLAGLAPGKRQLQARLRGVYSEVVAVEVPPDRPAPPVALVLSNDAALRVQVTVTAAGASAGGAFVFVQGEESAPRLANADASGQARLAVPPPHPSRLRAAALWNGQWVLGPWQEVRGRSWTATLSVASTGGLEVRAADRGAVALEGPAGWELGPLLLLLGQRLYVGPEQPLRLEGLPTGQWRVAFAGRLQEATVSRGRWTVVELK